MNEVRIEASAWAPPIKDGKWDFGLLFPTTQGERPISIAGKTASYPGLIFKLHPEKTGGEFFGPVPWAVAFAGAAGGMTLTCDALNLARNLAEGEAAQANLDGLCPDLLSKVTVEDLDMPVQVGR